MVGGGKRPQNGKESDKVVDRPGLEADREPATGGPQQVRQPDEAGTSAERTEDGLDDGVENEENLHERLHKMQYGHKHSKHGHIKEIIKPDPTVRSHIRTSRVRTARSPSSVVKPAEQQARARASSTQIATAVDEEQLHQRFIESISERGRQGGQQPQQRQQGVGHEKTSSRPARGGPQSQAEASSRSVSDSSSSSAAANDSKLLSDEGARSPPPSAIIIPASVAESLSSRSKRSTGSTGGSTSGNYATKSLTREQLEYGPLLKAGEVQVLYRSSDADSIHADRHLKEEQAKLVAPNMRQSPIAIMSINPTYQLQNKPLVIEYPALVEKLRLNNTGFSWEVKIPYQISMTTALYGAHLNQAYRYRLDQFHCHWGATDEEGSEHTVDNRAYSAELHLVHYNMEKYHTISKAARHPDGLVVLSVFLDAQPEHHNHAELEKIVSQLKSVPLKGEHAIMKQAVRIENLLPVNKSYWSYQGSLTTPPYFESVTWFIMKVPIKCSKAQIDKFRNLKSSLRHDGGALIRSNHRKTQPLNGRTIVNYDESLSGLSR